MDSAMKNVLRSYLHKCGDGRGLDKFLRRNSYSSDERDNSTPITTRSRNKTKSLESLTNPCNIKDPELRPALSKSSVKDKSQEEKKTPEAKPLKSMEHATVVVRQSGEKLDKKKSQFNYESVIEITLPSAPIQSNAVLDDSREKTFTEEKLEEPIEPILCTPAKPKIPPHNNKNINDNMSPESLVSNKQNPMEWDSFIPGYEPSTSQQNFQLCNPMELGDNELNALKTYFQRIGLQLPNENLVVVIKNRQESEPERQLKEIKRNKEKWQKIYEKYKEKYHHQSNIDFESPEAQSTPKIQEPVSSKVMEKCSQTSLVKNIVKSTQVDDPLKSSKECQVTSNRGSLSSKHSQEFTDIYQNQSEVAESFEFIAGSMKQQQQQRKNESPVSSSKTDDSKHDGSSTRHSVQEDISNFDDSLKVAIALLNSLLESRHMKPELKRNLAGKVIQKIVQIQTSRSIQTSTLGSSGIYPLSNSSRASSAAAKSVKEKKDSSEKEQSSKESSKSSGKNREEVLKDCLKPMTQSEVNYQHSVDEEPTKGSTSNKSVPKDQLMDYVKREKQSHLKWIEKEIEHLRNLRDLLKRNETPISMDENCPIYANLSLLLLNEKPKEHESVENAAELMPPPSVPGTNVWNSHANTKKVNKHRSKLETPEPNGAPSHDESLASFIDSKNRKFMERYEKHQQVYEDVHVYTRPYSGNRKLPEIPRVMKSRSSSKKTQPTVSKDVQTSTSIASSSVFESSDSISVPVNTFTKTSTTHYQSGMLAGHNKKSSGVTRTKLKIAETQTTDSICRTQPIFEANFGTTSTTVTQRINRMTNDKQQQTHLTSVKYTLSFDKKSKANVREFYSLPQTGNSEYVISKSSKEIYNQISSATLDNRNSEDKENHDADTIIDDYDELDLQSCLNHKRPDIFTRFEERRKCIAELNKLRALRNGHRKRLLLLTSDKSIEGKLLNNLPELRTTRMFSTKALKLQTQKILNNLTETRQKKHDENVNNLRRKNRLMTEIFSKNLQRNVLQGNMNLSNTVSLISKKPWRMP